MFSNFRLDLHSRLLERLRVNRFCLALMLFRVLLGLSHGLFSSPHSDPRSSISTRVQKSNTSLADGSIYKLQAKISGHAVALLLLILNLCFLKLSLVTLPLCSSVLFIFIPSSLLQKDIEFYYPKKFFVKAWPS